MSLQKLLLFIKSLPSQSKSRFVASLVVLGALVYLAIRYRQARKLALRVYRSKLQQDRNSGVRRVVEQLKVEAHLIQSYAFLAFRDETNEKRRSVGEEANETLEKGVLPALLELEGMSVDRFQTVLKSYGENDMPSRQLHLQYQACFKQFDHQTMRPDPLSVHISKFNPQSMKVVLKKYYAYVRFKCYAATKDMEGGKQRLVTHVKLSSNEELLKDVFNLYIMNFEEDSMLRTEDGLIDRVARGGYFLELRKAYYQLLFEKEWASEVAELEQQHFSSMALLYAYANRIRANWYTVNPLDNNKPEHGVDPDINAFLKLNEVSRNQLSQAYLHQFQDTAKRLQSPILVNQLFNSNPYICDLKLFLEEQKSAQSESLEESEEETKERATSLSASPLETSKIIQSSGQDSSKKKAYVPLSERIKKGTAAKVDQKIKEGGKLGDFEVQSSSSLINK